ncbi:MAG: alpha/beta fold hydrolase [Burkholderiales bacterium]|nr:alpha/beta fold hydrolase [Burkholderiales bacterium]
MPGSQRLLLPGPAGAIETVIDAPAGAATGIALVAHPHPLYGGTLDNKVVQTLAKTMVELGYLAVRPNFRGVGASEGVHDEGNGETDDLVAVVHAVRERHGLAGAPLVLAGFSFGSLVVSRVARRLPAARMVFVGTAVTRGKVEDVPEDSIIIHGETDDVVPLEKVLRWAEPQDLPVVVIPGADHFFHRRLHLIRNIIRRAW